MQSAIAKHLQCPRSQAKRVAADYAPPYPAWVASGEEALRRLVMGYFGIQWRGEHDRGAAFEALADIEASFAAVDGPAHLDRTHYVDEAGYDTLLMIAYWSDPSSYLRWDTSKAVADWWADSARESGVLGFFREILSPRAARFETLFSTQDRLEGAGAVMGAISVQDIQEHGYWGSMRERLPLAQTDPLLPSGELLASSNNSKRIQIAGHRNVAIIRSGQEWTDTQGSERDMYLARMEPTLRAGMEFLRDQGRDIGCYFNRYLRHIDRAGQPLEKSFGLSYWHSLADMERWAEFHPTHVAIFGTFMEIVQALNFDLALRLYHEVSVVAEDEQQYEYLNCHSRTGLIRAALA